MKLFRTFFRINLALTSLALTCPASAATFYWDNTDATGAWQTAANWATDATGTTNPAAAPVSADDVVFNVDDLTAAQSVYLNAGRSVNSLTFTSSGATTILSSATAETGPFTLTLGTGGITVAAGSGAVAIGDSSQWGTPIRMTGSQSWINNSTSSLQVRNSVAFNNNLGAQTLTIGGSGNTTVNAEIRNASTSGSTSSILSLTKIGTGTLTLSGTGNTYTGLTTVTAGTLNLNKSAGTTSIAGNILVNGGNLSLLASNQIADTASIEISSGSFNLGGRNETISGLSISGGTMTTGAGVFNAGDVVLNSTNNSARITVSSDGTFTANSITMAGTNRPLAGTSGGGNILIGGNGATLTKVIIGSGGLSMTGQTIQINRGDEDKLGAQISLNGNFTGNGNNAIGLATSGGPSTIASIDLGAAERTFEIQSGTTTLSIPLVGDGGGILKTGSGTLTLSSTLGTPQANTYTGATRVSGGQLNVSTALANTSTVSVSNGTLALGGANLINDAASIQLGAGGVIQAGGNETFGTLAVSGASTLDLSLGSYLFALDSSSAVDWSGGLLTILGWNGSTDGGGAEQIIFGNDASGLTATQLSQIQFSLVDGFYSAKILATGEIVPDLLIPEASSAALILLGGTGLMLRRKRREAGC